MSSSTPLLAVRGLRRTYAAELAPVRALRGVDLEVVAGDFVAIQGPSGSGKSTLLNLVAGLDIPDDGSIEIEGQEITGRDPDWLAVMRRRHIGYVFQFFHLLDSMTAADNVVLPMVVAGTKRSAAESEARELLELLGLGDRAGDLPEVLSGGQRQRLAIARALANRPTLLLADEPTGALDSDGGREVIELFRRLNATGQTIVLVTHSAEVAAGARRQVTMRDGRVETDSRSAPTGLPARMTGTDDLFHSDPDDVIGQRAGPR